MTRFTLAGALVALMLAGCTDDSGPAVLPPPQELTAEAIGHYCGMGVLEHAGPKGQIILASSLAPVWFSSARDAIAFTLLPDEPRDIRAVYVSDMARAPSWEEPGPANWIDAHKAVFVIDSRMESGMGTPEAIPFSDRAIAEKFASENGGSIVRLLEIPRDYVLGGGDGQSPRPSAPAKRKMSEHLSIH
jgi:copper chaperone NosL